MLTWPSGSIPELCTAGMMSELGRGTRPSSERKGRARAAALIPDDKMNMMSENR